MEQVSCRLDGEVLQLNMYDLAFQTSIGLPIEVEESGVWVSGTTWSSLQDFVTNLKDRISKQLKVDEIHDRRVYFYAGPDFVLDVSWIEFVCAIARNPHGEHQIRRMWGDHWGDWKQYEGEYKVIRESAADVTEWPDFDESNPDVQSQGETHFQTQIGGYQPNSLRDGSLEANSSVEMTLQPSFSKQYRKQIRYPSRGILLCRGGVSWKLSGELTKIQDYVQRTVLSAGEVYLPYIGRFHMKGDRLCFEASRLLRDRIHGRTAPEHRLKAIGPMVVKNSLGNRYRFGVTELVFSCLVCVNW